MNTAVGSPTLRTRHTRLQVILVPGNPGCGELYVQFIEELATFIIKKSWGPFD